MSNKRIRALYEARLTTWAAARGTPLRIAYQNKPFVPVTGETYLKAILLPADTRSDDLQGTMRTYLGVFGINVVAPINTGPGNAETIADEIAALFVMNARLTASSFTVQQITPAGQAVPLQDATTYTVPVSFEYRSDTA